VQGVHWVSAYYLKEEVTLPANAVVQEKWEH
jgi:hypothetical protein